MLEIFLLVYLWKKMGSMMMDRGYFNTLWFQIPVILCWFGGAFFGAFVYGIIRVLNDEPASGGFTLYLVALGSAALTTALLFLVARCFPRRNEAPHPLAGRF